MTTEHLAPAFGDAPIASDEEMRRRLHEFLGAPIPISPEAMRAALENPAYALRLMEATGDAEQLTELLRAPDGGGRETSGPGDGELLAHAAAAFARWAKTGFAMVARPVYQHRLATCHACNHLGDAPAERLVYRLLSNAGKEHKICTQCGCFVVRKAKLPTENCPVASSTNPQESRWGEPMTQR
ncbi:hypothetical protein C5689_16180 [Methylosinus sporium]|uniref:Uncharacterized protein n=2 Tax=Methylosinus sporium TaxID=428 RepID=A0A2U1SMJ1_METSR|nr:hypothetical protein C5689_16180 [Methylosinus sporium]